MSESAAKKRRHEGGEYNGGLAGLGKTCCRCTELKMENARAKADSEKQRALFEAQAARLASRIASLEADRRELLALHAEAQTELEAARRECAEKTRALTVRADELAARERDAAGREMDAADRLKGTERRVRELEEALQRMQRDADEHRSSPSVSPDLADANASPGMEGAQPTRRADSPASDDTASARLEEALAESRRLAYELRVARETERAVLPALQDEVAVLRARVAAAAGLQDALLAAEAETRRWREAASGAGDAELRRELEARTLELARARDELGRLQH